MEIQKKAVPKSAILPYLAPSIRPAAADMPAAIWDNLEEIRLGAERPVSLYTAQDRLFLSRNGQVFANPAQALYCNRQEIDETLQLAAQNSIYAVSDKLKYGYLTIPGGHRIGVTGTAVQKDGEIVHIKDISSLNIRIAHAVYGAADAVLPHIMQAGAIRNTMIIGPPQSGKTTLLRDLTRQIGNGAAKVGLVDERGEIAAMHAGIPQQDVGLRTDVLDFCPKEIGMPLLVRSMSPDVIVTDEIGLDADAYALMQTLGCGVKVIASAHGFGVEDVLQRPFFQQCLQRFDVVIELCRQNGASRIAQVLRRDHHDF